MHGCIINRGVTLTSTDDHMAVVLKLSTVPHKVCILVDIHS